MPHWYRHFQVRAHPGENSLIASLRPDAGSVYLTDAGRALLPDAESLVDHAARFKDTASLAAQGKAGVVRIGIGMGLGEQVNAAVTEHAKHFPSVEVELHDFFSTRQNHAWRQRMLDLGFMRPPVDAGLMSEPIVKDHFEVVICRKHPLAGRQSLTLAELALEPLLIHDRSFSTALYDKILDLYRRAGVTPKVTQTSSFPYEEAMLIASGKGIYLGVSSSPGTVPRSVIHFLWTSSLSYHSMSPAQHWTCRWRGEPAKTPPRFWHF